MQRIKPVRDDIINHRRLAAETPATPLRLDYRSQPTTPDEDHRFAVAFIVATTVAVGVLVIAMHTVGDYLLSQGVIGAAASLGFGVAVVLAIRKAPLWAPLAAFIGIPLVPPLLALLHYATRLSTFFVIFVAVALALFAWLLHVMAAHYGRWLATGPRVPHACVAAWRKSWAGPRHWIPGPMVGHTGSYLVALATAAVFTLGLTRLQNAANLGVALVILLAATVVYLGISQSRFLVAFGQAISNWLSYGAGQVNAPGIFKSPAGGPTRRRVLTIAVLFLFSSVALVSSGFWGVSVQHNPAPWQELFAKVIREKSTATAALANARGFERPKVTVSDVKMMAGESQAQYRVRFEAEQKRVIADADKAAFTTFIKLEPTAWVALALDGIASGDASYVWPLLTAAVLTILYPVAVFMLVSAIMLGFIQFVVGRDVQKHSPPETGGAAQTEWLIHMHRLQNSDNGLEREHLWMGAHAYDDYPVILNRPILSEHAYIVGDSGSGKTALGITGLVQQLILRGDAPVVILDLKGDADLFGAVMAAAGERFRFFGVEVGRSTHTFNPFEQGTSQALTLNQVCETILEALHLNHGEGYGRSYYSRLARSVLGATLRRNPGIATFTELYKQVKQNTDLDKQQLRDAFELIAVIESLASFEQLNITAQSRGYDQSVMDNAIFMPRVLEQNQVVYFWLPAVVEPASVREIAKLALYALLQASFIHVRTHGVAKQSYLVVDEFQRIASSNFKVVLEQARSFGIGAILANQTVGDLNTPDVDLRPTVQTNTRLKMCFSATDLDQQDALMLGSGEAVDYRYSVSYSERGTSESFSEYTRPRLQRNDIIRASDDPLQCILQVHRGSGYTQLSGFSVPVRCSFTMPADLRDELRQIGWPDDQPGTIKVARNPLPVDRDHEKRIAAGEKFQEKAKAEQPSKPVEIGSEINAMYEVRDEVYRSSELAAYGGPFD